MTSALIPDVAAVGDSLRDPSGLGASLFKPRAEVRGGSAPTPFMSDRQQRADFLWRHYRCEQYESRAADWHGRQYHSALDRHQMATTGVPVPPGFYDAALRDAPLEYRRPLGPFYLTKAVVDRFSALLFGEGQNPKFSSDDPDTTDWLEGVAKDTALWAKMDLARQMGGAMGSVAMSYHFQQGKPRIEIHDPRYATPTFSDRTEGVVESLEIMYQYQVEVREAGGWEAQWFWYRRVIDAKHDTVWPRVPVDPTEPNWSRWPSTAVHHGLGHCPVVWIQNLQNADSVDGDPDCHGIFDLTERIDCLNSQADRGTVANVEPTVVICSDDALPNTIRKGTDNAVQLSRGSSMNYLEVQGVSARAASELADRFEGKALLVAQCVLETQSLSVKTATEIKLQYGPMLAKASKLRDRYGEFGVVRLMRMMLEAARELATPRDDGRGGLILYEVKLSKKKLVDPMTDTVTWVDRKMGKGEDVSLTWPSYFPSDQGTLQPKVQATAQAKDAGIIDTETAIRYLAPDFGAASVKDVLERVKKEAEEKASQQMGIPPGVI